MVKRLIHSRKGVGTALGAVFYIGLVIFSLAVLWTISAYQTRYLQARDKMVEWDIKRMSEELNVVRVNQPSGIPGYTFDIIVNNTGGALVEVARIYIYDSEEGELWGIFDKQTALGEDGFINGEIMPGEGNHTISVKAQETLANEPAYRYRIVVCTKRGRQFSFSYPPPPPSPPAEEAPQPPILYVYGSMKIRYVDSTTRPDSDAEGWCNPWIAWDQIKKPQKNDVQVKITIRNNYGRDIIFEHGSIIFQASTKQGQRQVFLGGTLSNSFTILDGETISIVFDINYSTVTGEPQEGELPFVLAGLVALSTSKDATGFLTCEFATDGLLVPI